MDLSSSRSFSCLFAVWALLAASVPCLAQQPVLYDYFVRFSAPCSYEQEKYFAEGLNDQDPSARAWFYADRESAIVRSVVPLERQQLQAHINAQQSQLQQMCLVLPCAHHPGLAELPSAHGKLPDAMDTGEPSRDHQRQRAMKEAWIIALRGVSPKEAIRESE